MYLLTVGVNLYQISLLLLLGQVVVIPVEGVANCVLEIGEEIV